MNEYYDAIIVGTGAAGLYCASESAFQDESSDADQSSRQTSPIPFWHRAVSACSEEKKTMTTTLKIPCARAITKTTQKPSS